MQRICPYCNSRVVKKNHNGITFQCVYCRMVFNQALMAKHLKKQTIITTHATPDRGE